MKISTHFRTDQVPANQVLLIFEFNPSAEDLLKCQMLKGKLSEQKVEFYLSNAVYAKGIHSDLIALVALLLVAPFTDSEIWFNFSISSKFADVITRMLKLQVKSDVCVENEGRAFPQAGREALAFSGGVDSVAALQILPDDTVPVFMNRVPPEGKQVKTIYRADAAISSCDAVRLKGYQVQIIDTSMEHVRTPVGFSVDWTNAAGAVLYADYFNFRSVSFGMIMESAFYLGHNYYSDLASRSIYSKWAPLFDAVNMPICLPTSGFSEVLTSSLVLRNGKSWKAQSCVRGTVDSPCMNCFKCFRKKILDARISGSTIAESHFDIVKRSSEVKRRLLETPIHHENVFAYSLHGLNCQTTPLVELLLRKTTPIRDYAKGLSLFERVYPSYKKYIPEHLRDAVETKVLENFTYMSDDESAFLESWNIKFLLENEEYLTAQNELALYLSPPPPTKA